MVSANETGPMGPMDPANEPGPMGPMDPANKLGPMDPSNNNTTPETWPGLVRTTFNKGRKKVGAALYDTREHLPINLLNQYDKFNSFLTLKKEKGGVKNITIGELENIMKGITRSEDVLYYFFNSILEEITENGKRHRNEDKQYAIYEKQKIAKIRNIISGMTTGYLPFGITAGKAEYIVGAKEDKLDTLKEFLKELLDWIETSEAGGNTSMPTVSPTRVGGKRRTLKKKYLRRKSSKRGKNKRKTYKK